MPTGSGKTLSFVLPSLITDGLTVVIEPTLSLIQDMKEHLVNVCDVATLTSENIHERDSVLHNIVHGVGNVKFIFTTPETVFMILCFVHCVKVKLLG